MNLGTRVPKVKFLGKGNKREKPREIFEEKNKRNCLETLAAANPSSAAPPPDSSQLVWEPSRTPSSVPRRRIESRASKPRSTASHRLHGSEAAASRQPNSLVRKPSPSRIGSRRVSPAETPFTSRCRAPLKPSRRSRGVSRIAP